LRSRKDVIAKVNVDNLHPVVDIAGAGKLAIPVVQTVSLA